MARYRCDLCNSRAKSKFEDYCRKSHKPIPKGAIDPPDFCYVWDLYEIYKEEDIEWIAEKK